MLPCSPEVLVRKYDNLFERLLGTRGVEILSQEAVTFALIDGQIDLAAGLTILRDKRVEVRAGMRLLVVT